MNVKEKQFIIRGRTSLIGNVAAGYFRWTRTRLSVTFNFFLTCPN